MKQFTIGEIFRLGLLKTFRGEAYKDKATVSRVVSKLGSKEKLTPWGMAKTLSEKQIRDWNNRFNRV